LAEVTFGEWLKRRRKTQGLTQIELAQQVHCSVSAIRKFETEQRRPSEQIVAQLVEIFNIPPEEQELFQKFVRGDWMAAPANIEEAPWRTSNPKHNLPIQLTSFIGRKKETKDIKRLLKDTRILSLVGPGGNGKTRLSIQLAGDIVHKYKGGIWLVELAPVSNPAFVPTVTAAALKLPPETKRPAIDMLCDYLRERQLLLLLDNCEHLVEACAQMADTLLHTCPDLHILVTSREALGIPGEVTYRVPSLKSPDIQQLPPIDSLTQYEAVKLFIDRAVAVLSDFQVSNDTAPAVAQICHHLDGIPLAIELAAAKVSVLSVEQISERLDDRFRLLTGGSRTALERHQTLRAAIDWSYGLLSSPVQTLFRRLSVFVNGWSLEGAEMICSDEIEGDGIRGEDILDLLTQLVNKSLVIAETSQCESRYRMLETVRQYASERLAEAGEGETLRDFHLNYFLNLAETAEPHLRRAEQIEWLDRLECEHDNLRAALERALGKPSAENSLRLAGALGPFWKIRDHWKEGPGWLRSALEKCSDEVNETEKAARAKALYREAELAEDLDDLDRMKESAEAAYQLCHEIKDRWGIAFSRSLVALFLYRLGREDSILKSLVEQSITDFRNLGDIWGESRTFISYIFILRSEGKRDEVYDVYQKMITLARESGDRILTARNLISYSNFFYFSEGQYEQAENLFSEAEHLLREVGNRSWLKVIHTSSAEIIYCRKEYEKAKRMLLDALEYYQLIGEKWQRAECMFMLALILDAEGDIQKAITYMKASLDIFIEIKTTFDISYCTTMLGYLNFKQGNFSLAKDKLSEGIESVRNVPKSAADYVSRTLTIGCSLFVETNPQTVVQILSSTGSFLHRQNMPRDPIIDKPLYEQNITAARAKLSEEEFNTNWEIGKKMSLEEAIDCALSLVDKIQ